jgi:hypothetical protein
VRTQRDGSFGPFCDLGLSIILASVGAVFVVVGIGIAPAARHLLRRG